MPRPKKRTDEVAILLDVASGYLSSTQFINQPVTLMRIQQAIERHPDLKNLLTPIIDELIERDRLLTCTRTSISTAKTVLKNLEL